MHKWYRQAREHFIPPKAKKQTNKQHKAGKHVLGSPWEANHGDGNLTCIMNVTWISPCRGNLLYY